MAKGDIIYSEDIPGETRNHNLRVRFDKCDRFVGINQWSANDKVIDRVLLSPTQVKALLAFVNPRKANG